MGRSETDGQTLRLAPEERLLLACAVPPERLDPELLIRYASEVSDWEAFTGKAMKSKLAPLVSARLGETGTRPPLPRPLFMRLASAQVAADGFNRRLLAERNRLLNAFKETGISVLPLKGCALADTLYGDPSLRLMGDLDLLFRAEEFGAAAGQLTELGYVSEGIDSVGETLFVHSESHLHVDAHAGLDPSGRFRIPSEDLWRSAGPLPADGQRDLAPDWGTLSVQHHLIHALLHAARHRLDSLGPLVDAAWIAARWPGEVRWEALPDLAKRWRCREALGFALGAAHLLFGLEVPEVARERLRVRGWRKAILDRLWPGGAPLRSLEQRSNVVRYTFSALTTAFPGGFVGATHRFRRTRPNGPKG